MNSFRLIVLFAVIVSAVGGFPVDGTNGTNAVSVVLKPELRAAEFKKEFPNTHVCKFEKTARNGFIPETTIEASCRDPIPPEDDLFGECTCEVLKRNLFALRLVVENAYEETTIESAVACRIKCDRGLPGTTVTRPAVR